jgi:hypothetical protein
LIALFLTGLSLFLYGCQANSNSASPKALLDKYFSSAMKQDYATTYTCYYKAYQDKVSQEDYVKHRKQASILRSYKVTSLKQSDVTAQAEVLLTFAPSKKLSRNKPVTVRAKEDLIKEDNQWKIKVW